MDHRFVFGKMGWSLDDVDEVKSFGWLWVKIKRGAENNLEITAKSFRTI